MKTKNISEEKYYHADFTWFEKCDEIKIEALKQRFADVVTTVFQEYPSLIAEYDRLNKTNILKKLSPIDNLIDEVTGKRETELKEFFKFIDDSIFKPMIMKEFFCK